MSSPQEMPYGTMNDIIIHERSEVRVFANRGGNISLWTPNPETCCEHLFSIEIQDVERIVAALRRVKREVLEGGKNGKG